VNTTFLKVQILDDFLKQIEIHRHILAKELLLNANRSIIRNRRARMLSQLSRYESDTIEKIMNFETTEPLDYFAKNYLTEISKIVNRSA
jgi:hypothetical protein